MNELKTCPFCKETAVVGLFLVGCKSCMITFPFNPNLPGAMNEAIKKWNERKSDD